LRNPRAILTAPAVVALAAALALALAAPAGAQTRPVPTSDPIVALPTNPAVKARAHTKLNGKTLAEITDPADQALLSAMEKLDQAGKSTGTIHTAGYTTTAQSSSTVRLVSMDPGCDVDSSTPGGYDMCGGTAWPDGDVTSSWDAGAVKQTCWAGLQERDSDEKWRVWAKCHVTDHGSVVSSFQDIDWFQAWKVTLNVQNGIHNYGTSDPSGDTATDYYRTGTKWRAKDTYSPGQNGVFNMARFNRTSVNYLNVYVSTSTNYVCGDGMDWVAASSPGVASCVPE
jgi:hypothetical protein